MRRVWAWMFFVLCLLTSGGIGLASSATPAAAAAGNPVLSGDQTVESTQDSNTAGVAQAWPFSHSTNGTTASISIYVDSANTAAKLSVGLYANNNGRPGSLLTSGSLSNPNRGAWNTIGIGSAPVSSGKTYWVALLGASGTPYFRDRAKASCSSQGSAQSSLTSLPSTWSPGPSWGSCPVSAYVNASVATTTAAPVNTALPTITGTPQQGKTLTEADGTWTGSPLSYASQWQVCDSSGARCSNARGETATTYALNAAGVGQTIREVTTATNAGGSTSANTAATNVITAASVAAPSNTALPAISGTTQQGSTLTASNGTWSGSPTGHTYQWRQCDSSGNTCTSISGAASTSYTLASGDVGHTIRTVVTATNAGGSALATSAQSATITSVGSCASSTPNSPDGPDPNGGCFPGPATTGVPAGTVLTNYTGSCTVTTANSVVDSKTINCNPMTIAASNVQISKSRINGEILIDSYPNPYSFTISDSEVVADSTTTGINDGATGIGKSNFTAIRDNIHGGIRSIWCELNCTESNNWLHGQVTDQNGAAHESATRMGEGAIITHNSLVCDAQNVPPDAGCSADLTGYGDFEIIEGNTISDNLFMTTEGGTCAYGGSTPNKPYSNGVHSIVFQNNIFQKGPGNRGSGAIGHCGYWFGISDFGATALGSQWINNRWDDGSLMPSDG